MKRIGIIGGTFDPIHFAHIHIAEEAKRILNLKKVIFMVSGTPPHKKDRRVTEASIRFKMAKEALKNKEDMEASDYEIKKNGFSYTYETLEQFKREDIELFFITGADCLINLESWKNVRRIFECAKFVVFKRPDFSMEDIINKKEVIEEIYNKKIIFLDIDEIDESSTKIREMIKEGKDVTGMIPREVQNIIKEEGLYKKRD